MNSKAQGGGKRMPPTSARPEVRLVATAHQRLPDRLDHTVDAPPDDPSIDELVAVAKAHPQAESWMLAGGEPTLRKDFPKLVSALAAAGAPNLGMITDGLALAAPGVPAMLAKLGLQRVRIRLASSRHDAHDWLFGQTGAWRRAVKAIQACVDAGLFTEIECTVTRPTHPYIDEAMELFIRLGARAVVLRRVTARGGAAGHDVAVAARLGLMQTDVEAAVQTAVRRGVVVMIEGFPRCAVPAASTHVLPTDAVVWALPTSGSWPFLQPRFELPASARGCSTCEGAPACVGAPTDYVRRFGRTEIDSEGVKRFNPGQLPPTPLEGGEVYPPPRGGRFPQSRVGYARLAVRLPSLGGDPLVAVRGAPPPERLRFVFVAPSRIVDPALGDRPGPAEPESSRAIRIRMVEAAQVGAGVLRVASSGSLAHPEAADLLRETTRLQFQRVEVAGDVGALDVFGDMQLRRLRGISRVDAALFGPDAASHDAVTGVPGSFDQTMRVLERLGNLVSSIELGSYAVLTSAEHLAAFAEAWDFGDLPGQPWFRLAPRGGSLPALARAAEALPEGPARDAIAAVLPKALLARPDHVQRAPHAQAAWGNVPETYAKPSGSDRYGCYTDRPSADQRDTQGLCPGYAEGWVRDV